MNDATKTATTQASIEEMHRALEDPTTDIRDHISRHTLSAGPMTAGASAVVDFSGNSANWRDRALALDPEKDVSPLVMHLELKYQAKASVGYLNQETNRIEHWPLTPEQQETADRYASQAIYRLTTIAEEETPEADATDEQALAHFGGVGDQAEKLNELTARTIRMAKSVAGYAAIVADATGRHQDQEVLLDIAKGLELLEQAQKKFKDIEWVKA